MSQVLEHTVNQFGGAVPKPSALPADPETFRRQLQDSLEFWREKNLKVVWLEIPIDRAALVPLAVEAGFTYHHADQRYVMLTLRLQETAFIPPYATHYIGAGGVALNARQELLVVCERHRATRAPFYKLPGGAVQPGEHLVDAVIREVLEETGVATEFDAMVCFRHWHGYRHGKSDIYFVARLRPLSTEITRQVEEIDECLWMPVEQYLGEGSVSPFNKRIVRAALESPGVRIVQVEGYPDPEKREFFMP